MNYQRALFDATLPEVIIDTAGDVKLYRQWLSAQEADKYFEQLRAEIQWQQSPIRIQGKQLFIPRLNAWYGDADCHYAYSGIRFAPLPWSPTLLTIKTQLEDFLTKQGTSLVPGNKPVAFNSVLANLYRNGQDSVAWHADDELELGARPLIASISLGAVRRFSMKPKASVGEGLLLQPLDMELPHGSLLVMAGATQQNWLHQVAKTRRIDQARINLTFRWIYSQIGH